MYEVFSKKVLEILPQRLHGVLDYITSPGIVIPTLVLMVLVIYNLVSTAGLLKEANEDLKEQVRMNSNITTIINHLRLTNEFIFMHFIFTSSFTMKGPRPDENF